MLLQLAKDKKEITMTALKVSGMTCGHCQKAVQEALEGVDGSQEVNVDLATGIAKVQGDVDPSTLIAAIEEEGYNAKALG